MFLKLEITHAQDEDIKKYRMHIIDVHVQSKLNPRMCATHIAFNKKGTLLFHTAYTDTVLLGPQGSFEEASLRIQ